ncbi:NADPH-dependent F420 reductase [Jatrophihabitans sp. GAS493]|uniref:NADPH-dependent F420 reductase n=1 Tax=Jatrophihabitans sp. GAS493 TaxID=1907575 RepID=UPI000BB933E5|nr:NADPH-dependent F420 reductase [Jatrophihabitans sp. GAS493]
MSGAIGEQTLAILGGTGDQGRGLAYRFASAGMRVLIGSRDPERAAVTAAELSAMITAGSVRGGTNSDVASDADLAIIAVPWGAHAATLAPLAADLAGKIVIDCVNPIGFDERGPHRLECAEGSAAEQAAQLLPESRVTAAFHHVSAVLLADPAVADLDLDVMVLGDDRDATDTVAALAELLPGVRGIFAGRLRNAGQVEALTANLIAANRRYKTHAGIRITGI